MSHFSLDNAIAQTPHNGQIDIHKIATCIGHSMGMHRFIGLHPVVYCGENDGQLIRHVVPHARQMNDISSHGSKKTFGPHVDNPDLPLFNNYTRPSVTSPDTLSLFCVKQDPNVPTDLIFLDDVLSQLNDRTIEALMMPIFMISRPDSFTAGTKNSIIEKKPILEKNNCGNFVSRFDAHRVFSDYNVGNDAINTFIQATSNKAIINSFYMKPGDFLLFKNKRVLHSRRGFTPKFDGHDRWLIRIFGLYKHPDAQVLLSNEDATHLNTQCSAFANTPAFA